MDNILSTSTKFTNYLIGKERIENITKCIDISDKIDKDDDYENIIKEKDDEPLPCLR